MARRRLDLSTATGIQKALNKAANDVLEGSLGVKEANCIAYLCNTSLNAIKAGEVVVQEDNLARARELLDSVESVIQ